MFKKVLKNEIETLMYNIVIQGDILWRKFYILGPIEGKIYGYKKRMHWIYT